MAAKKGSAKKKTSSKKTASAKKPKMDGDALTRSVLASQGISVEVANARPPGLPMATFLLESETTTKAYAKASATFAKVPSFNASLANAAPALVAYAKDAEAAWSSVRFVKQKGEGRGLTRKDAEAYRSKVIRTARFLFRKDAANLAELDRIAEGEGLADLIRDHEELATLATKNAALFAQAPQLGDVVSKCTAFAETLKSKRDDTDAQSLHEARNRAVAALDAALDEIREAAKFLYEGSAAAMAAYLATPGSKRRRK